MTFLHASLNSDLNTDLNIGTLSDLYLADEADVVRMLSARIGMGAAQRQAVEARATILVEKLRDAKQHVPLIDTFLLEYGLSTTEGVILMRLAEALLRTPDRETRNMLMRDRLMAGDWASHKGQAASGLVNLTTFGLRASKAWIEKTGGVAGKSLIARLGDRALGLGVNRAMVMMGEHFVLGKTIKAAIDKSRKLHKKGFSFSYDMLGEAAMTAHDAERYFQAYMRAVNALANSGETFGDLSVKLSALHPRYEMAQREACVPELVARVKALALVCKTGGFGLAIDAEEADRLEVSLEVVDALMADPDLEGWDGLSVVVQAYQRRATAVIEWLVEQALTYNRKLCIRLVKGAYWDSEIKRAQEMGLESYPVFTRKENTDVSYLACARILFENADVIYPQFATHNAHSAAAVLEIAQEKGMENAAYEFQCLHGMGEALHLTLIADHDVKSRIYAPVGQHADLLPYLVRRLLENGANSSFVNQLVDPDIDIADIIRDPQARIEGHEVIANPALPIPRDYLNGERLAAEGLDLTQVDVLQDVAEWFKTVPSYSAGLVRGKHGQECVPIFNPAYSDECVGQVYVSSVSDVTKAVGSAAKSKWAQTSVKKRAAILRDAARRLEDETPTLLPLIVREAGKTLNDAVAEISEAVDFCRYYADRCEDAGFADRKPLGVMACISPWNFPLAIFIGQVAAALAAGNTVVAKPAEQTPLIAAECVRILSAVGLPKGALHMVYGSGAIGAALVAAPEVSGVCFTGSTATAKKIAASLAQTGRSLAPLIAETGGINAMIVDSTALLEQTVGDVVASAFQSAGQRCSACRLVCVQDDIADDFIEMLSGAMQRLKLGNPADIAVDVGPVIDDMAANMLREYILGLKNDAICIAETSVRGAPLASDLFVAPIAFEIPSITSLTREVFGPVLHVVRFKASEFDTVVPQINALGYGLTMGLHTRIDTRVDAVMATAKVGNLYVNRNQIGAVVGVQPFGGEGLSGTGPKAGGPQYLHQMSRSEEVSLARDISVYDHNFSLDDGDMDAVKARLHLSRVAQGKWQKTDRAQILQRAGELVGLPHAHMVKWFEESSVLARNLFTEEVVLPGPTGERNTLKLSPRGTIIALQSPKPYAAILTALAAGNSVMIECDEGEAEGVAHLAAVLEQAGAPKDVLMHMHVGQGAAMLACNVDGVIAEAAYAHIIAAQVLTRVGKIIPVLTYKDAPERFALERTVTIDTTAAGGNASLLAMV